MVMKNKDVAVLFIAREKANGSNLTSDGTRLFSYNTCIAEFENINKLYINKTKYSSSTSRHQSYLNLAARRFNGSIEFVDNIYMNKQHLI